MAIPWFQIAMFGAKALMQNSADKKLARRQRQQQEVLDQIDQYAVEDQRRLMEDINVKHDYMLGATTPAMWETMAGIVNPINPVLQSAQNAAEYDKLIDTSALTEKPTGFVAEGWDPAVAAAASRVAEETQIDNALKADVQAMGVQGPRLAQSALGRLGTINMIRGGATDFAKGLGGEQFVENPKISELEQEAKRLGLPITRAPDLAALGGSIATIQHQNEMLEAVKALQA